MLYIHTYTQTHAFTHTHALLTLRSMAIFSLTIIILCPCTFAFYPTHYVSPSSLFPSAPHLSPSVLSHPSSLLFSLSLPPPLPPPRRSSPLNLIGSVRHSSSSLSSHASSEAGNPLILTDGAVLEHPEELYRMQVRRHGDPRSASPWRPAPPIATETRAPQNRLSHHCLFAHFLSFYF